MSDAELPQPIYPGGSGASYPPQGGAAPPPAGPPGYGAPTPGGGGGGSKGSTPDPKVMIGIAVAAIVIIAVVVFAITQGGDDSDNRATPGDSTSTTLADDDSPTTTVAKDEPGTTTAPPDQGDDLRTRAEAVAAVQLDSAGADTVACMADGFEASPTLLDTIEPMAAGVTFSDPGLADEFASIVANCATYDELVTEFENLLIAQGVTDPELSCMVLNLTMFESPQWQDFIATMLQPAEAAYTEQLLIDLSYC